MAISPKTRPTRLGDVLPPPVGGCQINACRNPGCVNFDTPAVATPGFSDPRYRMDTSKSVRVLRCKACQRESRMLSNACLEAEWTRLATGNGMLSGGCPVDSCINHHRPIAKAPHGYALHGFTPIGRPRFRCRLCGTTFVFGADHLKLKKRHLTKRVLEDVTNAVAFHGHKRKHDLSAEAVYTRIDFLWRRMMIFERYKLDRFFGMKKNTDIRLALCTDGQDQLINWWSRDRREPVQVSCISTADNRSGFVLRSDVNFDPTIGNAGAHFEELLRDGDFAVPGGFGRHHRYELAPFLRAAIWNLEKERESAGELRKAAIDRALAIAVDLHRKAAPSNEAKGNPPEGAIVNRSYTALAHYRALDEMLPSEARLLFMTDVDHTLIGAALSALRPRIVANRVDMTVVAFQKELTQGQKESRIAKYRKLLEAFVEQEGLFGRSIFEVRRAFVAAYARQAVTGVSGIHADFWHIPIQTMYEPDKRVGIVHMRTKPTEEEAEQLRVRLITRSSLHGVDSWFNHIRNRLTYMIREGISRASGLHYDRRRPYRADMLQKTYDIMRVYYNWCEPRALRASRNFKIIDQELGRSAHQRLTDLQREEFRRKFHEEPKTPAMRLGIARRPVRLDTILYTDWDMPGRHRPTPDDHGAWA